MNSESLSRKPSPNEIRNKDNQAILHGKWHGGNFRIQGVSSCSNCEEVIEIIISKAILKHPNEVYADLGLTENGMRTPHKELSAAVIEETKVIIRDRYGRQLPENSNNDNTSCSDVVILYGTRNYFDRENQNISDEELDI